MSVGETTSGTEAGGSKNEERCQYCYVDKHFTKGRTMDEIVELSLNYLEEFNKDLEIKCTIEEVRAVTKEFSPQLKRWK